MYPTTKGMINTFINTSMPLGVRYNLPYLDLYNNSPPPQGNPVFMFYLYASPLLYINYNNNERYDKNIAIM